MCRKSRWWLSIQDAPHKFDNHARFQMNLLIFMIKYTNLFRITKGTILVGDINTDPFLVWKVKNFSMNSSYKTGQEIWPQDKQIILILNKDYYIPTNPTKAATEQLIQNSPNCCLTSGLLRSKFFRLSIIRLSHSAPPPMLFLERKNK